MKETTTDLSHQLQFVYASLVRKGTRNYSAEEALEDLLEAYEAPAAAILGAEGIYDFLNDFIGNVANWLENETTDYETILDFSRYDIK